MDFITCKTNTPAAYSPPAQSRCLKPVEQVSYRQFVRDNEIDESRFSRLYQVAKRAPFGKFKTDFTQFGASEEASRIVQQMFHHGLNFHQLEVFLNTHSSHQS